MRLQFQHERCLLLHPFRILPAGADLIDAPAVIGTTMVMAPATMDITDNDIMGPGSMSGLATATMVGGVGSDFSCCLALTREGRRREHERTKRKPGCGAGAFAQ
jgi:hypothetical protein